MAGTSALMLAAVNVGWRRTELAHALGLVPRRVNNRVRAARARYGDTAPALTVDAPLDRPPHPLNILRQPVADREWLTAREAADLAGVHPFTIRNWRQTGLLPNTIAAGHQALLYLRADVQRVLRGPRYTHGISYAATRAVIRDAGTG